MLRLLLWLIVGLPVGFVLVSLAVTSTDEVAVRIWPLTYELKAQLGFILIATIMVVFFIGLFVGWLLTGRLRRRLRSQRRQIEDLRDEIAATHARLGQAISERNDATGTTLPATTPKAA